jgi:HSP20 family protein
VSTGRSTSRTGSGASDARSAVGSGSGRATAGQSTGAERGGGRGAGVTSGVGAGDLASGGISTTTPGSSRETPRGAERQRDLEPVREGRGTQAEPPASSPGTAQPGMRAAGGVRPTPGLSAWLAGADNPFAMMRRMEDDLDRVFRTFGIPRLSAAFTPARELEELLTRTPVLTRAAQWSPQIEVFEREGNLVVNADLPGVKREDVEVNVDDDVLTIRGERRQEHRETDRGYLRTERNYGSFFRQIPLPSGVDPNRVEASFDDGVLQVVVPAPRNEQQRRRRIEIR